MVFGKSVLPKKPSFLSLIFFPLFLLFSSSASAADCTSPAGKEGAIRYNKTDKNLFFCNGTVWVSPRDEAKKLCAQGGGSTPPAATTGPVQCWGDSSYGKTTIPVGLGNVKAIAVNNHFTCAIKQDDTVQCWGANMSSIPFASIGTVKSITNLPPTPYACAIKTDDTVACWSHSSGLFVPAGFGTVKSVSVGSGHICAVKTDDTVRCWGNNTDGQATVPVTLGTVKSVAASQRFSCAVKTNGAITCWGADDYGQISSKPGGTNHVSLVASSISGGMDGYMCSLKTDDTFKCFGYGGHLIAGTFTPNLPSNSVTKGLGLNNFNVCSIKSDDTVQCWGDNAVDINNVPTGLGAVKFISPVNPLSICAIKSDDTVQCWGGRYDSTWGTYNDDAGPVPVALGPVIALSRAQLNVCVIKKP